MIFGDGEDAVAFANDSCQILRGQMASAEFGEAFETDDLAKAAFALLSRMPSRLNDVTAVFELYGGSASIAASYVIEPLCRDTRAFFLKAHDSEGARLFNDAAARFRIRELSSDGVFPPAVYVGEERQKRVIPIDHTSWKHWNRTQIDSDWRQKRADQDRHRQLLSGYFARTASKTHQSPSG